MKFTVAQAIAVLAFTSTAAAQHKHQHARNSKEQRREVLQKRVNVVETVVKYEYVTVDENGELYEGSASTSYSSQPVVVPETTSVYVAPTASSTSATVESTPLVASAKKNIAPSSSGVPASSGSSSSSTGLDATFPDGTLDCSTFPSSYGAIALDYLGSDGWTGIQLGNGAASSCSEGALCSYACPPGYSKSQWPATQPSDGESRGGLLCSNGKLTLTRPSVSTLCVAGYGSAQVVNKMSTNVAICRTDYPGSENMVIPTNPEGGATLPLTVVVGAEYYEWQGGVTSAQYYVNKAGVSQQDGCIWGTDGSGVGNFAPLVFGAGYSAGSTWISMFPNPLANGLDAGYDVAIVPADGSSVTSCTCTYVGGIFYENGVEKNGCTVAVSAGSANYVFTKRS